MERKISGIDERTNGLEEGVADSLDKVRASVSPLFGLEVSPELFGAPAVHGFANYALWLGNGKGKHVTKMRNAEIWR